MLTADQIARNVRTLTANVTASQGLPVNSAGTLDFSALTYDEVIAFNRAFASFVVAHPASFDDQRVASARNVLGENPQALEDDSISADIGAFGVAFVDNVAAAGEQVAGIGQGVLSLAGASKYLIPIVGVTILVFWLMGLKRKLA